MAVLKNRTQGNFTIVSNNIFHDSELTMKDRGVLCTLISFPTGWNFSVKGLSALVPDGEESIRNSIFKLERIGYLKRNKTRTADGKYTSEVEVFETRNPVEGKETEEEPVGVQPPRETRHGKTDTDDPSRITHGGSTAADERPQYNTYNKTLKYKNDNKYQSSINHNEPDGVIEEERSEDIESLKSLIAENIKLDWLLETAERHGEDEVNMVHEIYELICDMVCYPRKSVLINKTKYPGEVVKGRFLKLRYEHICGVLNRVVDASLGINNISGYLIAMLYNETLSGTIGSQARLHDDYLKSLRGEPYSE